MKICLLKTWSRSLGNDSSFYDVDDMVQTWNYLFLEIMNKHAPIKNHRIKRNINPEILDLMKGRNKCKINGKMDEYRNIRNTISTMIDKAKKEMYRNKLKKDKMTLERFGKYFGNSVPAAKCGLQKMF